MIRQSLRDRIAAGLRVSRLKVKRRRMVEITAAELREVCAANPLHPLAMRLAAAIVDARDGRKLFCEQIDLLAVIENQNVVESQAADGAYVKELSAVS